MPREPILAAWASLPGAIWRARRPAAACAGLVAAVACGAIRSNGQVLPPGALALAFPTSPTSVRLAPDGRALLVEFDTPLPDGEAARASRGLGPLLEGTVEGWGAVRFLLAAPARSAAPSPTDPRIVLVTADPEPEPTEADRRRLALLQARALAKTGDLTDAEVRLHHLAAETPLDPEPLLALADVEAGAGHWQRALGLYDGVGQLFPEAADVFRERNALSLSHAPSLRPEFGATFGPNGERAQSVTLTGEFPLAEQWRVTASLQTSHDAINGLRRSFEVAPANYSGVKTLASLGVTHDWSPSVGATRIALYAAPSTLGAEIEHDVTTSLGETTIGALYHQPYWGTVMAFAANARRDHLGLAQRIDLPGDWRLQAGVGLVRYGIPNDETVNAGPSVLAGVSKGVPAAWLPLPGATLRLGYRLEAEYLSHAKTGPSAAGPLPLLDTREREIHSLYSEATAPLGGGTASALLGYAIDRYGGGGPQALLRLTSGPEADRLVFSGEAGIEPSLDAKPRTLFHLGFSLIWRFGGV